MADEFNLIEKSPITLSELKETLNNIQERDGELNFRGNRTVEYLNNIATISKEDRAKFIEEIKGLEIGRMRDDIITKLADFLPQDEAELDLVMKSFGTVTLPKDQLDKILGVCKNFSA